MLNPNGGNHDFIPVALRPKLDALLEARGYHYKNKRGKELIDFSGQTLNLPIGQPGDEIKAAVINQIKQLVFASSRFGSIPFIELSKRLADLAAPKLDVVNCKLCDGSDAVETCLKIGRLFVRNNKTLAVQRAWHGETIATLELASTTRSQYIKGSTGVFFSREASIESLTELAANMNEPCCVILDPVGVSCGLFVPSTLQKDLFRLQQVCTQRGHFLIFDEIQTFGGFLGDGLFCYDSFGVSSDAVAIGKALGCGFPVAAALYSKDVGQIVKYNEAEFTHGGQPPACAAALAYLRHYERTETNRSRALTSFREFADEFRSKFEAEYEIRDVGFFLSLSPKNPLAGAICGNLYRALYGRGLITRLSNQGRSILIKSPITVANSDLDRVLGILNGAIKGEGKKTYHIVAVDNKESDAPFVARDHVVRLRIKSKKRRRVPSYVTQLMRSFTTIEPYIRGFEEQVKVALDLAKIGIPVPEQYSDENKIFAEHVEGRLVNDVLGRATQNDQYEVEAIFSQLIDYVDHSHRNNIVIGDRWARNSIWNGETLYLIDFDIGYKGSPNLNEAFHFEQFFSIFHHIVYIKEPIVQHRVIDRYAREYMRRSETLGTMVMQKFWNFYLDTDKPRGPKSLPYKTYAATMIAIAQVLDVHRSLRAMSTLQNPLD